MDNQIDDLLCLSTQERAEQRRQVIRAFRNRARDEIIADEGDEIREQANVDLEEQLGRPAIEEEIDEAFDERPR